MAGGQLQQLAGMVAPAGAGMGMPLALGGKPMAAQFMGKMQPPIGSVVQGQNPGRIIMPSTPMGGGLGRFMGGQVPRIQPPALRTFQAGGSQTQAYNPFQQLRVADPRQFTPRISVDGMNMGGNFGPNVGIPQEPILSAPDSAFGGAPAGPKVPQIAPQDFLQRILMQSM